MTAIPHLLMVRRVLGLLALVSLAGCGGAVSQAPRASSSPTTPEVVDSRHLQQPNMLKSEAIDAEGLPMLGAANAPVTLTTYTNFL